MKHAPDPSTPDLVSLVLAMLLDLLSVLARRNYASYPGRMVRVRKSAESSNTREGQWPEPRTLTQV